MPHSDFELAKACDDAWTRPAALTVAAGDVPALIIRATVGWQDWGNDLLAGLYPHSILGPVHAGFIQSAREIFNAIPLNLTQDRPYVLAGHSRGGAIALLVAGLLRAVGRPPAQVVTFGAPRAGCIQLREYLSYLPVRQYRHGEDAVTTWPDPPYCHARSLLQIGKPLDPFRDHAIGGYIEALRNGQRQQAQAAGALDHRPEGPDSPGDDVDASDGRRGLVGSFAVGPG